MKARRKKGLFGSGFMVFMIAFFVGYEFSDRLPNRSEALGLITGLFMGILYCVHVSRSWDPVNLVFGSPSTPATEERNRRLLPWAMVLAGSSASLANLLLGAEITRFVAMVFAGSVITLFLYTFIVFWRSRPDT